MNQTSRIGILTVLALLVVAASAHAITGLGIGLKAGVVTGYKNPNLKLSKYKMSDLAFYGGFVKFGGQGINLEVGVETFSKKTTIDFLGTKVPVKVRDVLLTATAKLYFKFPVIKPFVGAGIGAHKFTYTGKADLGGYQGVDFNIPGDATYFGYHLVVGAKASIPVLPFDLFVEGKIGRANSSGDPVDFTIFSGGVIFNLP